MRYAVISDIHGNAEALRAVLDDIESRDIDVVLCLGDIVGYYPDPELCVELVRQYAAYSVAGNHDYAAIGRIDTNNFTCYAFEAMEWTKKMLSEESKKYLSLLPMSVKMDGMLFTHSSPASPASFIYIFPNSEKAILEAFSSMVHHINFIGHAHWPFIMTQEDLQIIRCQEKNIEIYSDGYYLINVGSVGQPRNFDHSSSYAVFDTDLSLISLIAVEYDYTVTQRKVLENNLPPFLAERLAKGR